MLKIVLPQRSSPLLVSGVLALIAATLSSCAYVVDVPPINGQPNIRISTQRADQTEPSAVASPSVPGRLVVAAIDRGVPVHDTGQYLNAGCRMYVSNDGGATWTSDLVRPPAPLTHCSDPALAADRLGAVYLTGFFHRFGAAGDFADVTPFLARLPASQDTNPQVVTFGDGTGRVFDKPYLAVDQRAGGDAAGSLYLTYSAVSQLDPFDRQWRLVELDATELASVFSGGGTLPFTDSQLLSVGNHWGAHPAVGPDGQVFAASTRFVTNGGDRRAQIVFSKVRDAEHRSPEPVVIADLGTQQAAPPGLYRHSRYPVIAISHSATTGGWAYLVFSDDPPLFTPIAKRNASKRNALGMNNDGDIVGWFVDRNDAEQRIRGFMRTRAGNFTVLDFPGAAKTVVQGINVNDAMVGTYTTSYGAEVGFRYAAGQFEPIVYPGARSTHALDINDEGRIVGWYEDQDSRARGFLRDIDGSYRSLIFPESAKTFANGINAVGLVVGSYETASGETYGFVSDGLNLSQFAVPGAKATRLRRISNMGVVVGDYSDDDGTIHAFRLKGSTRTDFGYPGQAEAFVVDVTDGDELLGYYLAEGLSRPFLISGFGIEATQDVWMMRSTDSGSSWSSPYRVHDANGGHQFFPWLCIDPNGGVFATWLDTRQSPTNHTYDTYATASPTGAMSFLNEVRVTTLASDPRNSELPGFIGDYTGLACEADSAFVVWPDTRDGRNDQNIYGARLRVIDQ